MNFGNHNNTQKIQPILRGQIQWHLVFIAIVFWGRLHGLLYKQDPLLINSEPDVYFVKIKLANNPSRPKRDDIST
jgi:hypothetical protein